MAALPEWYWTCWNVANMFTVWLVLVSWPCLVLKKAALPVNTHWVAPKRVYFGCTKSSYAKRPHFTLLIVGMLVCLALPFKHKEFIEVRSEDVLHVFFKFMGRRFQPFCIKTAGAWSDKWEVQPIWLSLHYAIRSMALLPQETIRWQIFTDITLLYKDCTVPLCTQDRRNRNEVTK